METQLERGRLVSMVFTAAVIFFLVILFFNCFAIIRPGERGVVIVLGKMTHTTFEEGIHFKAPFITDIKKISIRIQKDEVQAEAATRDLQYISTKVVVNWNMNPGDVGKMYQTIGDEHAVLERIITPAINEVVKAATAKRTAENILIERAQLKSEVDSMLNSRLTKFGINLVDLSFVNFDFSPEFNRAIEEKQIAEQMAKKAVYQAQQAKMEAEAQVNRATGEAEAKRLLSITVTPKILALEFFQKWDGHMPSVVGSGSNLMLMMENAIKQAAQ